MSVDGSTRPHGGADEAVAVVPWFLVGFAARGDGLRRECGERRRGGGDERRGAQVLVRESEARRLDPRQR